MKNRINSIIVIFIAVSSVCSCKKFVQIDPPDNQLVTPVVFADSADATAAVVGMYSNIMKGLSSLNFCNGAVTVNTGFSADELIPINGSPSENELYTNSISSTTNLLIDWSFAYKIIYQANACIEGLSLSTQISNTLKRQLIGESKFMRVMVYFNLVNIYGAVPYITTTDYRVNATLQRTPVDTIYNHLIADLNEVTSLLQESYPTLERVRPNKFAAAALLARIYLYTKNWAAAETTANIILASPSYTLESNLNSVFLPNSKEAIFQLVPLQPGFETAEGYRFIPSSGSVLPKCAISNYLLGAFEPGDQRKAEWLGKNVVGGQEYYYPKKYKLGRDGNSSPLEYYTVLRLSEQYLIRAEARAHLNNLVSSSEDLNTVRSRAGLSLVTGSDQLSLLTLILHERQTELFCEWGHRWFDLKRTELIDSILGVEKPNWQTTDALYPIPFTEIQNNPYLVQNPGYN